MTIKNYLLSAILILLPARVLLAQNIKSTISNEAYIQGIDSFASKTKYKPINLSISIEQGLRQNFNELERKSEKAVLELDWEDSKSAFWMPQFKLTLTSTEQHLGQLYRGKKSSLAPEKVPSGSLALIMDEYAVFNWGKDFLVHLNQRETYRRETDKLTEERRELKQDIIILYFKLVMSKKIEQARKDQLRHSSFVYRLNREKVALKKVSKQEYYLSRAAYLRAQTDYYQAKIAASLVGESMAQLIADTPGTRYLVEEDLLFRLVNTPVLKAVELSVKRNPTVLNAIMNVENSKRDYDLTLKENLPLPKFSISIGTYSQTFGRHTSEFTEVTDSDVNLVASINATWALTGKNGLFNGRKTRISMNKRHLSFRRLATAKHNTKSGIRTHYKKLLYLQNQYTILEARVSNLQKAFDALMEDYLDKRARFYEFLHTLVEKVETQILFEQTKFQHLREKVLLAKTIGIENLPGENFEKLAKKIVQE